MRKTINVLAMLLALFPVVAGCSESEPEVAPEALLSAEKLIFSQPASQQTVKVSYVGDGLAMSSAVSSAPWCSADASADAIIISVDANETEEMRSAVVSISFNSEEVPDKTIEVMQESGSASYLKTTAVPEFEFGCRGGEYKFSVMSSAEWKAELVDCSWAEISSDASSVTITAPENGTDNVLEGKVRVSAGHETVEYAFTQATVASDKYLSLLGDYDIYCDKWYTVTSYNTYSRKGYCGALGASGTLNELCTEPASALFLTRARLTEDKYGISYYLEDCFLKGQKIPVNYNKETGKLELQTLWNTGTVPVRYGSYAEDMPCFIVRYTLNASDVSMTYSSYNAETLVASVSEDGNTITLDTSMGQAEDSGEVSGSGITLVYMDMSLSSPVLTPFLKIYMPYGDSVELRKITAEKE